MISIELLWKATVILAGAFAGCAALRGSGAALRHFVWTAAFAALLLLPVALRTTPKWNAPMAVPAISSEPAPAAGRVAAATPAAPAISLTTLWWIGFLLTVARFLAGTARTAWIVRRGRTIERRGRVRIVASAAASMPMTWGIVRPVVILPEDAAGWPAERTEIVLLHELTHVRRRDLLAQSIAHAACCLYWFHPLAWLGLRELRKEREQACDDGVLRLGVPGHEYASHLMDIARAMAARRGSLADAPAIANPSGLEKRVRVVLDRSRNRGPLQLRAGLAVAAAALATLLPLSSINVFAQVGHGAITGIVRDPSGARIPNCTIIAKQLDTGNEEKTTADLTGAYRFVSIPSGRYSVAFLASGFKMLKKELTLVGGASTQVDGNLEVGTVNESVRILGGPKSPAASQNANAARKVAERIRIGGNVSTARLLRQPKPVYPEELKNSGVEGTVLLSAIIGKDGLIQNVKVVRASDYRLGIAAMEAIRQWRYEPTRLNGEPIEVVTEIDMQFELGR